MRIFFGKIKPTADNRQIVGAFYETLSPVKLGDLKVGDYAFIISGKQIHLWKARQRVEVDGKQKMEFDIIHNNLPLTTQKLVAFKFFMLDSSLMVLTVRQSPKAFHQINICDNAFTEKMLVDRATYQDKANYRKIKIFKEETSVRETSNDIQFYFKDNQLEIFRPTFISQSVLADFIDNLSKFGSGRREKDKALQKVLEGKSKDVAYNYEEFPILRMYDALFNEYGEKEIVVTDEDEVEQEIKSDFSLELTSLNQIYYGPPGTGKTFKVMKSFCLEEEVSIQADKRIRLDSEVNFWHLAPGRSGYLWGQLEQGNVLGYEWAEKSWGDLKQLKPEHIEDEGWGNYQLISYLREVKQGDYICVISGKRFLGIAEVTADYDFKEAQNNSFSFQTVPIKWLKKFDVPLLLDTSQTKTFVRLNWGTRWTRLLSLLRENGFYFNEDEVQKNKVPKRKNYTFVTFHQSFSYEDFIEGIKPVLPESDDEENIGELHYEVVSGIFYQACDKAVQLAGYKDLQDCLSEDKRSRQRKLKKQGLPEHYLIIDEMNRGNIASIFGELITLIEDDKRIGAENEVILSLPYSKASFGVPLNLRIIGTMNTADRSVEALDAALRRRFVFEEMAPEPSLLKPERMLWQFWWENEKYSWDDEEYIALETPFYQLLGFPDDKNNEKDKEVYWEPMRKMNIPLESQIDTLAELVKKFSGVNLCLLLDAINKRIEKLLGRDYMIGHAYFINVRSIAELKAIFFNKILPLLQEYFYRDYGRIGLVIGMNFLDETTKNNVTLMKVPSYDIQDLNEGKIYHLKNIRDFDDDETFIAAVKTIYGS